MHIALIAPPFIPVPPMAYGGTELFVAHLAEGLRARGHGVTVYANGESRVRCEVRWRYRERDWPIVDDAAAQLKNADHTGWAIRDAARIADIVHLNDAVGMPWTALLDRPVVYTLHHPCEPALSSLYQRYPSVHYVAISAAQARREPMRRIEVVHHGVPLDEYNFRAEKEKYLVFLGRMAPCKGVHLAIEVARRARLPLKLVGEIQPVFQQYWTDRVAPWIGRDGIDYVGEAGPALKSDVLARARALLFPIQWEEPFGIIMIEAMACGTPVLALPGGSVAEVVRNGVNGWICRSVDEMVDRASAPCIDAASCRAWVAAHFSRERMVERYLEVYDRALASAAMPDAQRPTVINQPADAGAAASARRELAGSHDP